MFSKGIHYRRHQVLAAIAGLALLAAPLAGQVQSVSADDWCWGDPVISVNGRQIAVNVGVQGSPTTVRSAVDHATITVHIPQNVSAAVLAMSNDVPSEAVVILADQNPWTAGPIPVNITTTFTLIGSPANRAAAFSVTTTSGMTMTPAHKGNIFNILHQNVSL